MLQSAIHLADSDATDEISNGSYGSLYLYQRMEHVYVASACNWFRTVQIGIGMLDSVDSQSITLMIAGVVLIILPSISIFIAGQKQLIRGMFSGAVKG